jgi:hypothetical protein
VNRVLNYHHQIVHFSVYRAPGHLDRNCARRNVVRDIIAGDIENHGRHPFQATAVIEGELRGGTPEVTKRHNGIEVETTWS